MATACTMTREDGDRNEAGKEANIEHDSDEGENSFCAQEESM